MIGLNWFSNCFSPEQELVVFDVGAHVGDSVEEFCSLFSNARIFAFEPDRQNFFRLTTRFAEVDRVQAFNVAVGQSNGRVMLHRNNYDATHSLLPFDVEEINRWADANDFRETSVEEVEQITLDAFCRRANIGHVDILKLDVQGGEMMAFRGADQKISQQECRAIFCEVEFRQLYIDQPLFWDISDYLLSRGYHFVNFVTPKVSELGVLAWADAIYVNNELWEAIAAKHSAGKLVHK